jgi:hypothetical protein
MNNFEWFFSEVRIYLGGKDLICLNGGKCKDHQCHCSEHFMGHDCSISNGFSIRVLFFNEYLFYY